MTNVLTNTLLEKYLAELGADEVNIAQAAEAFETAKAALDVNLRRYIALRDFVGEQLGTSPYARGVNWPDIYTADGYILNRGHFRFTGKAVGDAVLEVLREQYERDRDHPWLSLSQIIETLSEGGLGFPEPVQARAVNAALLKRGGVRRGTWKNGVAAYAYDGPSEDDAQEGAAVDPDDLPFE
jgi:hypothetical protein